MSFFWYIFQTSFFNSAACILSYLPDIPPTGSLDQIRIEGSTRLALGWACDLDDPLINISIHFYKGQGAGNPSNSIGSAIANVPGEVAIGSHCGGQTAKRFVFTIPSEIVSPSAIYAYAIGVNSAGRNNGINPLLSNSPKFILNNGDCGVYYGSNSYTGRHNEVGLSNGDVRFLCRFGRFYECGWEH